MDGSLTPLSLKSTVGLPQTVILPAWASSKLGLQRRLTIQKGQRALLLPRAVVEWMRNDKRYAAWFEPPLPEAAATPDPVDTDSAQTPSLVETWDSDQTVPVLRDYAARHGVELTKDDLKADVIAKLRAAGLPETSGGE